MFNGLMAGWQMSGLVKEKRELTSPKNTTWRGYVVKIAGLGETYEVQVAADQFGALVDGQHVKISGSFETIGNRLRLIAQKIEQLKVAT